MTTQFLSDHATGLDLLNNEVIAKTIVGLICESPESPITVGIHGDWGAGKSCILEMIEAAFGEKKEVLCLKFNGWRFQGFEDAKIALIEGIVNGLIENRSTLTKASKSVKEVLRRIDWLKLAKKAGGLAFTAATGVPTPDLLESIVGVFGKVKSALSAEGIDKAVEEVQSLFKEGEKSKNVPEEVAQFHKAFDALLREAKVSQLVVLIDDLDRCLPDTAIDTLEAVRLFLFTRCTAFVVAADEAMIEYSVRKHFPDLPESTGPRTYARNYLEKLIQIPFRIPALGEMETRMYVSLLLIGSAVGDTNEGFRKLVDEAKKRMRRPWEGKYLDATVLKETLGKDTPFQEALLLSERVGPVLAATTAGNPRQIKRFINSLLLRMKTAEARGFGSEVKIQVLAKLMLAERNFPDWFDRLAAAAAQAADGTSEEIRRVEKQASAARSEPEEKAVTPDGGAKVRKAASAKAEKEELKADAEESSSPTPHMEWAAIQPPLSGTDLRPYLFVVKDRKNFFGPLSVLGHLIPLVDKLCGPRLAVQAQSQQVSKLALAEAEQIFELLRGRIVGGQLRTRPAGIEGIQALVKAHPSLERRLIDLVESLPATELGPWAVTGWTWRTAETQGAYRRVVEKWAQCSNNHSLAKAAELTLESNDGAR